MFSDHVEIPKNFKECYASDKTSERLWFLCEKIEGWGKFLLWFIVVSGLIIALLSSITVREISKGVYFTYTDRETSFDFMIFITMMLSTITYAFIEYCVYHILALLISSLASIVHNTRVTANIAIYNAAKKNEMINEESGKTMPLAPNHMFGYSLSQLAKEKSNDSFWICKKCATKNNANDLYYKDCGEYK